MAKLMQYAPEIAAQEQAALESVDFQDPKFFQALTGAYEDLNRLSDEELKAPEAAELLSSICKTHCNMNINFGLGTTMPCVMIPEVHRNNPLINDWIKNYLDDKDGLTAIRNAKGFARGGVNLKSGQVSGIFAELKCQIYMPIKMIKSGYTAEEMAAITLHEVGHLFVYFEFIARTVRTNQILAGVSRALDQSDSIKDREVVLMTVKQSLNLKDMDVKEAAKVSNRKVVEAVVLSNIVRANQSELGSNLYDENNFEMLADNYAARMGAGRAIVTALDKLHRGVFDLHFRSTPVYLICEAIKLILLMFALVTGGVVGVWLTYIGVIFVLIDSIPGADYDRPGARFKRMRNQLVEAAKRPGVTPDELSKIKEDIAAIDKVLEGVHDRVQVLSLISRYLWPSTRQRFNAEALQQELESLVSNDLFGRANDLKALA